MPLKIGRYPQGFLGLLGSKNLGRTPADLEDLIRPTVELTDLYASGARKRVAANTSLVTGPGTWGGPQICQRDEVGILYGVQIRSSAPLPAGTTYGLGIYLTWVDETQYINLSEHYSSATNVSTAGERLFVGWSGRYPLVGLMAVGAAVYSVTLGTNINFTITADVAVWPN